VNTYGIPSYKEVNPGLFTCVTFPFLFGVMFGDIMHGSLLLIFAVYLCLSKKEQGTLAHTLKDVRYLFLLMGIFASYCGLIYNDFTSTATQIFGEGCYTVRPETPGSEKMIAVPEDKDCIYPVGMDPIWFRSMNEITFMNSFKMKTSVIFGVAQMSMGTICKGLNAIYFRNYTELIFEVCTQLILLWALFGWMDFLIISKWTTDWSQI